MADVVIHAPYSTKFCFHKFSEIQSSARTLARSLGGLEEYNVCKSNVWQRYKLYETSYKNKEISKPEFDELVNDLVQLQKADHSSCTLQQKNNLANTVQQVISAAGLAGTAIGL